MLARHSRHYFSCYFERYADAADIFALIIALCRDLFFAMMLLRAPPFRRHGCFAASFAAPILRRR